MVMLLHLWLFSELAGVCCCFSVVGGAFSFDGIKMVATLLFSAECKTHQHCNEFPPNYTVIIFVMEDANLLQKLTGFCSVESSCIEILI